MARRQRPDGANGLYAAFQEETSSACLISSGACRAKYLEIASEWSWLRDFRVPLSAENHVTQVLRERRIFHLADIEHNPAATPQHIENARPGDYRTRLTGPTATLGGGGGKGHGGVKETNRPGAYHGGDIES